MRPAAGRRMAPPGVRAGNQQEANDQPRVGPERNAPVDFHNPIID
jgi:hypothetical protein